MTAAIIWKELFWPLLRMLAGLAVGLLVANLLESLNWARHLSRFSRPFSRAAHLGEASGAAFSLAFVSPQAANALLSERHAAGELSPRELLLANLFNSLPAYFMHTPTIFFLTWPVLGWPAVIYVGLTFVAALLRTLATMLAARVLLPPQTDSNARLDPPGTASGQRWNDAAARAWKRFRKRLPRLVSITLPVYVLMYVLQRWGFFDSAEAWLTAHVDWLGFLKPQAMGIIVLHFAAEFGAAIGAAGSMLQTGGLNGNDVVMALMVGNILSTPMRAIRHQLPSYAGYYRPVFGLRLIVANQALRVCSMAVVSAIYYRFCVLV